MKQSAVSWLIQNIVEDQTIKAKPMSEWLEIFEQSKTMEREQGEKFNMFLDYEKSLGISDEKTIERIKWYYNTYFNETYGGEK
jgi:hypothetical protein